MRTNATQAGDLLSGQSVGTVGGAVAGGVLGNQISGKTNKALGTVGGAVAVGVLVAGPHRVIQSLCSSNSLGAMKVGARIAGPSLLTDLRFWSGVTSM